MDVEAAFSRLPETHAAALRLRARGFDDEAIAAALALEPKAVAPLLRIAEAKLAAVTGRTGEPRNDIRPGIEARREACSRPTGC
jgi:DNA-directed RNA polymerase specialized sigma24 family protein